MATVIFYFFSRQFGTRADRRPSFFPDWCSIVYLLRAALTSLLYAETRALDIDPCRLALRVLKSAPEVFRASFHVFAGVYQCCPRPFLPFRLSVIVSGLRTVTCSFRNTCGSCERKMKAVYKMAVPPRQRHITLHIQGIEYPSF